MGFLERLGGPMRRFGRLLNARLLHLCVRFSVIL